MSGVFEIEGKTIKKIYKNIISTQIPSNIKIIEECYTDSSAFLYSFLTLETYYSLEVYLNYIGS